MIDITLRINREGEFTTLPAQETDNQCGKVGAQHYRYFVTIEASNKKLTEQGFVMENLWVDEYFQNRYVLGREKCASCEDMAQEAIKHFLGLFGRVCGQEGIEELQEVDLRRIYVRIHGSNVSFIEAEWKV